MKYEREAIAPTLEGIVTCGASPGYKSKKKIPLKQLLIYIDEINQELISERKPTIPCIIRKGTLVGRATTSNYREDTYTVEFMLSPRAKQLSEGQFYKALVEYANRIGELMQQEKIYLKFNGKTEVLKKVYAHQEHK